MENEKIENLLPLFPGAYITEYGELFSWRERKNLWVKINTFRRKGNPYLQYKIPNFEGKMKTKPVHYFVALAYLGQRPKGLFTCHNDGDSFNNHISNIRYDTPKANSADRNIHGKWSLKVQGTEKAEKVKKMYFSGAPIKEIREKLSVSIPLLYKILNQDELYLNNKAKNIKRPIARGEDKT